MLNEAYHIDNIIGMNQYPDGYFDVTVADPVYGIDGNSHRKNKSRGKLTMSKNYPSQIWDQKKPSDEFFKLIKRKSKNQIVWGGNYFEQLATPHKTPRREELQDWLNEHPTGWIVWDKVNGNTTFNDFELAWTSFNKPTTVYQFMWNGMMQGTSIFNGATMQGKKALNQKRIHPTEKPISLYKWTFHNYVKPGQKVLDPCLGSGSSRIAAYDMRIDFVGMEIEAGYFKDEEQRFMQYINQLSLTL